ncbi:MAG: D-glycerate dehydrogenase [Planctomycetota bacterium]
MGSARVVLTRRMPSVAAELLKEAGYTTEIHDHDDPPDREEFLRLIHGAAGLITMLSDRIDDEALKAAGPTLKVVANYAVGYDNVDLQACQQRGIRVTNTPGVLTDATADLAWTLILATARHVVPGDQMVRNGRWRGWSPMQLLGLQLSGATLGILGAGRIGSAVARRSLGFDMRVLYTDSNANLPLEEQVDATRVDLERLLAESDVLSLHIPMAPEHHHLIGAAQLQTMKPTAILINTARGQIVDEAALVEALRDGQIAGAGFDVYEHEPRLAPGLAELPNVVLLPHLGSATTSTRQQMARMATENVIAVLAGRSPENPVI